MPFSKADDELRNQEENNRSGRRTDVSSGVRSVNLAGKTDHSLRRLWTSDFSISIDVSRSRRHDQLIACGCVGNGRASSWSREKHTCMQARQIQIFENRRLELERQGEAIDRSVTLEHFLAFACVFLPGKKNPQKARDFYVLATQWVTIRFPSGERAQPGHFRRSVPPTVWKLLQLASASRLCSECSTLFAMELELDLADQRKLRSREKLKQVSGRRPKEVKKKIKKRNRKGRKSERAW